MRDFPAERNLKTMHNCLDSLPNSAMGALLCKPGRLCCCRRLHHTPATGSINELVQLPVTAPGLLLAQEPACADSWYTDDDWTSSDVDSELDFCNFNQGSAAGQTEGRINVTTPPRKLKRVRTNSPMPSTPHSAGRQ